MPEVVDHPRRGHCYKCGKFRAAKFFSRRTRNKNGLSEICKDCKRNNRLGISQEHRYPYFRRFRAEKRKRLDEIKARTGCSSCGENDTRCLQFHHLDSKQKDRTISRLYAGTWGWERILREIAKCVVLCANCHLKLHRSVDVKSRIA